MQLHLNEEIKISKIIEYFDDDPNDVNYAIEGIITHNKSKFKRFQVERILDDKDALAKDKWIKG